MHTKSQFACHAFGATLAVSFASIFACANELGPLASGPQPAGALSGKIVYVHGGHGYTADNQGRGAWTSQRPLLHSMVEDLGNKDQMDFFVDYLYRSGATIVPMRPVGHQVNEVVIDNTDPGVTFTGDWRDGAGAVYFGNASDVPYRFAETATAATAKVEYRPKVPEAGTYPVYTWVTAGKNRAPDQTYRIRHAGGETRVAVDHSRVGNGLVYLGSYYFKQGTAGSVVIDNQSQFPGTVVVADMIRLGNGRGDIDRGGGVSGFPREDEAGLYWAMWHINRVQGLDASCYRADEVDRTATISLAPRYSAFMNQEAVGPITDRVFVSFHSNASTGNSRGVLGLYNGNNYSTSRTPRQLLLAETLARHVNDDLVGQSDRFEHPWEDRGDNITLDREDIEFGEINNKYINNEFDATIVETGFHDNATDAEMLRDPRVRDALAAASCKGLIEYFHEIDAGKTPLVEFPQSVGSVHAEAVVPGTVTLNWQIPEGQSDSDLTGYVIYTSTDGKAFDAGRQVAGGQTTTYTIAGLDRDRVYYFRVAAKNLAGESRPSSIMACTPSAAAASVLIVDGFDRLDRHNNAIEQHREGGDLQRVRLSQSNPRNSSVAVAQGLHKIAPALRQASASADAVASGAVSLSDFDAVFWMLAKESSSEGAINPAEQNAIAGYLEQGGCLYLSGSEVAWDLDELGRGRDFCRETLRVQYAADDSGTARASGVDSTALAGVSLTLTDRAGYTIDSPDVLRAVNGSVSALVYDRPDGGTAAVQYTDGNQRLLVVALPFGSIGEQKASQLLLERALRFFELSE